MSTIIKQVYEPYVKSFCEQNRGLSWKLLGGTLDDMEEVSAVCSSRTAFQNPFSEWPSG